MSVAAIWRLDHNYSNKIDSSWTDGLFVMVSKDGKYWGGWTPKVIRGLTSFPMIGDPMPMPGGGNHINDSLSEPWETVRKDLLNNRLGEPVEGANPIKGAGRESPKKKQPMGTCVCKIHDLMRNGCPSSRGRSCPSM